MALILLRHTRPLGAEGLCYGRTDLALDDSFGAESTRLSRELPEIARIVTSPLSRCHRLAQVLAEVRGLPVQVLPDLIEMDFGAWEGLRWDDVPRAELDQWSADFHHARPHGGESVAQLLARARAAMDAATTGTAPVLAVTHAGIIKAALAATGAGAGWKAEIPFGGWVSLEWPCA